MTQTCPCTGAPGEKARRSTRAVRAVRPAVTGRTRCLCTSSLGRLRCVYDYVVSQGLRWGGQRDVLRATRGWGHDLGGGEARADARGAAAAATGGVARRPCRGSRPRVSRGLGAIGRMCAAGDAASEEAACTAAGGASMGPAGGAPSRVSGYERCPRRQQRTKAWRGHGSFEGYRSNVGGTTEAEVIEVEEVGGGAAVAAVPVSSALPPTARPACLIALLLYGLRRMAAACTSCSGDLVVSSQSRGARAAPSWHALQRGTGAARAAVWDTATRAETARLQGRSQGFGSEVCPLAWSPDGSKLARGSEDGTAAVWEAVTLRPQLGTAPACAICKGTATAFSRSHGARMGPGCTWPPVVTTHLRWCGMHPAGRACMCCGSTAAGFLLPCGARMGPG